jgi:DNA-binding NarL/FixJ family response regulator
VAALGVAAVVSVTGPVRVLLVDDDALLRAGLTMMLAGAEEITIVAEASNGHQVLPLVETHHPDVVLMDIRMPVLDGLSATEALRTRPDAPEVIVLTTFDADEHVLRALRAGAAGFLLKDTPPADIVTAVIRVAQGQPVLSPSVTRRLIERVASSDTGQRRSGALRHLELLTEREREIAVAVGEGKSNAEISRTLYLSVPTVKTHISRILTKLELNNRVQIALLVHDAGDPRP